MAEWQAKLQQWADLITSGRADELKESEMLREFLTDIFCGLLGYTGLANQPGASAPEAGLVQGSDGNFYGTTYDGGTGSAGTVFRINPSGHYQNICSLFGAGAYPRAALVQGSDGNFYGTTLTGNTVFKLNASLPAPANQMNGITLAGTNVLISVSSVAGETYQLQYATDLTSGNWTNVPGVSVTNSMGGPLTVTNFGGAVFAGGYYRLVITP